MKFVGLRFDRYACFESAFVPLEEAITVLVGKNNTGKTALLHAVNCLNAIPTRPTPQLSAAPAGYAQDGQSGFRMHIQFRPEQSDRNLLHCPDEEWETFVDIQKPEIDFEFRIPASGQAILEDAHWIVGNDKWSFIEKESGKQRVVRHNVHGARTHVEGLPKDGDKLTPTGMLGPLGLIPNTLLINAHRVASPQMPLQSARALQPDVGNLAQFLGTLQGNDADKFEEIQAFVTRVFPEYRRLHPESADNRVVLTFSLPGANRRDKLSHAGTGVEQILALATLIIAAHEQTLFLLDEPHSFLHPSAERELLRLLEEHSEHKYLISTHSPVILNAVSTRSIVYLERGKEPERKTQSTTPGLPEIYSHMGYKNSDFLLNDRIVFVEGVSDTKIIPVLLARSAQIQDSLLASTAFEPLGDHSEKSVILREKVLAAIGRVALPRIYLFDHLSTTERGILEGALGGRLNFKFLPRPELENYLIVPQALAPAINEEAELSDMDVEVTPDQVRTALDEIQAEIADGQGTPKGSLILERLYRRWNLVYGKVRSGVLIANHITRENQPALQELVDLVAEFFGLPQVQNR